MRGRRGGAAPPCVEAGDLLTQTALTTGHEITDIVNADNTVDRQGPHSEAAEGLTAAGLMLTHALPFPHLLASAP